MKKCPRCQKIKTDSEFYREKTGYLSGHCKECSCETARKYAKEHKEQHAKNERERRRRNPEIDYKTALKRFGLTPVQYEKANEFFSGVCCICKKPETIKRKGKLKRLAVDHDHKTGHLRGLLCGRCNSLIGLANENIEILESAIKYIKYGRIHGVAFEL